MAEKSEDKGFIGGEAPRREGTINVGANPSAEISTGISPGAENKRDTSGDQKVTVRALKTFPKHGHTAGDLEMANPGDEFETHRHRAAELRANGLIEYPNDGDANTVHGEDGAKRLDARLKSDADLRKIPENSRGTPLRNPKIELADVPADQSGRRK